jgi:hypothetical protein
MAIWSEKDFVLGITPILQQIFATNEAYAAVLTMLHPSASGNAATIYPQRTKVLHQPTLRAAME